MFRKIAQELPPAPPPQAPEMPMAPAAPPAMPDLGMGAPAVPDLSGLGGGMPPAPSAPMAAPAGNERQEIIGPIKSVSQIFYDMDIVNFVENNLHLSSEELTRKIWLDYGGKENGKPDNTKIGKRKDQESDLESNPEEAKKERTETEDCKWERLESGKNIDDIITYADLGKMVEGVIYGVVQKAFMAGMAPPGGAPGMPAMASNRARIIIAKNLEREYLFKQSDTMIKEIINKINLH